MGGLGIGSTLLDLGHTLGDVGHSLAGATLAGAKNVANSEVVRESMGIIREVGKEVREGGWVE